MKQPGKGIYVGSPSLINELTKLNLIEEWQLCVHPVITGKACNYQRPPRPNRLQPVKTKPFKTSGHVMFYYTPGKE
jgi:dihydrofolate reductase